MSNSSFLAQSLLSFFRVIVLVTSNSLFSWAILLVFIVSELDLKRERDKLELDSEELELDEELELETDELELDLDFDFLE